MVDYTQQSTIVQRITEIMDLRRIWVKCLNSGEFKQGKGRLAQNGFTKFCCLGVAEDQLGYLCGITRQNDSFVIKYSETSSCTADAALHLPLRQKLGISKEQQTILVCLNDYGVDFTTIGKVILELNIHIDGVEYTSSGDTIV